MKTLGILQYTLSKESEYIDEVARICASKGICVYQFTPFHWNHIKNSIRGLRYNIETNKWEKATFELPQYIYDRCFYPANKQLKQRCHIQLQRMKKNAVFLGEGFPNKWKVYEWLAENDHLSNYLPPTDLLTNKSFLSYVKKYKSVAIKPIFGSGGQGFFKITSEGDRTLIQSGDHTFSQFYEGSLEDVFQDVVKKISHEPYLIQPFLSLTRNNTPFDLRVVMQKRQSNQWHFIGMGYRFGKKGTFTSNLQSGGTVRKSIPFRKSEAVQIKNTLSYIKKELPKQINKHHGTVFEIGIDIGIDENGDIWILEVNSKPGYQTVLQLSTEVKKHYICEGPLRVIENDKKRNEDHRSIFLKE
ncbi:YheC/YheD family protein [Bacillus shivajii]|uniref:YheC/YheD family endospore coat-associated protein n=1 Tax=Bacillus shivajii TaxID=1983719 RepID=UPI001CFB7BB7|nr:YheC/YheD family protein [Bacillus shivajii]UCZ54296.1 YheC/YheD family protein [Bacillus shivajii]